jgi:hypothetical protein
MQAVEQRMDGTATLAGEQMSRRSGGRSRPIASGIAALLAAALALLLSGVPAMALSQRGHEFKASFGGIGIGERQFSNPAGVAVNETTGDVYVVDRGNNRVERFDATGKFLEAWGFGVKDGEKAYETCKAGEGCKAGLPGKGKGKEGFVLGTKQFISPEAIAVDNTQGGPSSGDVYVAADLVPEKAYVDKISATGEFLGRVTKTAETESDGRPDGVAVDAGGKVWVAWSHGQITRFSNALVNKRIGEAGYAVEGQDEELVRPGLAVDSRDHLYVSFEPGNAFREAQNEESPFSEEGKGESGEEPCRLSPCFAATLIPGAEEGELSANLGEAFVDGLFGESASGMSVDLRDNSLYVDHQGSVSAYSASGALLESFGSGHLNRGGDVAVNGATGTVYVADPGANNVEIFSVQAPAQPAVAELSATKITAATAQLAAQVNPTGASTTVSFQYGTGSCAEGGCSEVAATPATLGAGFEAVGVTASLAELTPGTLYHYRVIATGLGVTTSAEATFTTRPVALADNRSWEMVSPPSKNGVGIESLTKEGGVIQAAESGERITYVATGPSEQGAEGNRSPAFTQDLAERVKNAAGLPEWESREIAIPNPERQPGVNPGQQQEYLFFSPELSSSLVEPFGRFRRSEPKLSPEATEKTIYVRNDQGCLLTPASCTYTPLVTAANDTAGTAFGGGEGTPRSGLRFRGASTDLSHVVLSAEVPLTGEEVAPKGEPLYEWSAGAPLQLVNILPESGKAANEPFLGQKGLLTRNAISTTGERVIWEGEPAGTKRVHLYTRDMATGVSTQVDAPEAGVVLQEHENPVYQTASADGTKVFFTDEQQLTTVPTTDASGAPSLYVFDVNTGKLADLTVPLTGSESAGVLGLLPGASSDAATVYFVANGVLTSTPNERGETASRGNCVEEAAPVPGASCNLYVEHYDKVSKTWEAPAFIARLSNTDKPDWGEVTRLDLGEVTDSVSPSGEYFAFMSQRSLTGYDNRDSNPASGGARAEEVYLFNRVSGALTCVSCNSTGAPPRGVFDTEQSGEGLGLLVDRVGAWEGHWLAGSLPGWTQSSAQQAFYQSRYLSDTGRLFFDSAEPLVPAAENGKENVYEYERPGQGSCAGPSACVALISSGTSAQESAFLDASASGGDAFIVTASPLVASDIDTSFDVYDARVCSQASPCVQSSVTTRTTCESEATCKAPAATAPVFAAPLSAATGTGNLAAPPSTPAPVTKAPPAKPTRAQLLGKALKSCRKLKKRAKRVACERSAHKRYAAKKASRASGKRVA